MSVNHVIHPIPLVKLPEFPKLRMIYPLYGGAHFDYTQVVPIACYVWYVEGLRKNIIVDAGITTERFIARGHKVEHIQTLDEGLKKLGLGFGDIDVLILTHLHHEHITLAHKFPKARVIVQRAELEFARNPHPFYVQRAHDPPDYKELIEGLDYQVVSGDTKIDDGIEVLLTPGHSAGGQSIAVTTAKGIAIITGFCCIQENFEPPPELRERGVPFIIPGMYHNALDAYDSMARIKRLADLIVPLHEAELTHKAAIP